MSLVEFIFPKKCVNCGKMGEYVCPDCFVYLSFDVNPICLVCNRHTYTGFTHERCRGRYVIDGAFSSIVFGKVAKRLVYRLKYKPFLHSLKDFMTDLFYEGLIQNEDFERIRQHDALLIPIPLYKIKFKQRGYNQAVYLAKGLGEKLSLITVDVLERVRSTCSQVGLSRKERRENIKGAFRLKDGDEKIFQGKTVFLIDDVLTSGATLSEAAYALKRAGAEKVFGLTLAHGE